MIGLDTNVLLRWLIDETIWPDDDPGQTAAVAALLNDRAAAFYANAIVLAETLWVLEQPMKRPKPVIMKVMDRLLSASNLTIQLHEAVVAAQKSYVRSKCGIHDCLIAEFNRDAGCRWTATFDKDAGRTSGFRLLPTEV